MKFFDYEKIFLLSHGKPSLLLEYFQESKEGINFIVNPRAIVANPWVSDKHKAEYLGICALRSYDDYLNSKQTDLHIDLIPPWVPMQVITENPLIKLTNTKIILLKENI